MANALAIKRSKRTRSRTSSGAGPAQTDEKRRVQAYVDGVVSGEIVVGKLVRLAVERHLRDLATLPAKGFRFDETAGERAIRFYSFLRHSKGEWAGQVFELSPWQCFILWSVFGWRKANGTRRYRIAYVEVPRKNGKSTFTSGVGLQLLLADGEAGAEVYTAATKRDQARIVHSEAVRMVKSSPALRERVTAFRDQLIVQSTNSKFEPLGADSDTMDGLNISGAIVDELHAHKKRDVWDVIDTATGARRQPLIVAITTAGSDLTTVCGETHEYAIEILKGIRQDETFFAFVATIDESDEWTDPTVWAKANPNYGISVKQDDLEAKAARAKATPSARNAFLRLHLNVWTETETAWIPLESWDACKGPVDLARFAKKPCWSGLDLASKLDLTCLVLMFKDEDERDVYVPYFWLPEGRIKDRRGHSDYGQWVKDGFLEVTPGDVTDYSYIEKRIIEIRDQFDLKGVAYDPWNAGDTANRLRETFGVRMIEFRQGYASMNEPSKEFERRVIARQVVHDGHPVARWCVTNTCVKSDPAGNIKPVKPAVTSRKKIDFVPAAIMAKGISLGQQEQALDIRIV